MGVRYRQAVRQHGNDVGIQTIRILQDGVEVHHSASYIRQLKVPLNFFHICYLISRCLYVIN